MLSTARMYWRNASGVLTKSLRSTISLADRLATSFQRSRFRKLSHCRSSSGEVMCSAERMGVWRYGISHALQKAIVDSMAWSCAPGPSRRPAHVTATGFSISPSLNRSRKCLSARVCFASLDRRSNRSLATRQAVSRIEAPPTMFFKSSNSAAFLGRSACDCQALSHCRC